MSETERGDLMVAEAGGKYRRAGVYAWIGRVALVGLVLAILAIQGYGYMTGKQREREIDALQARASESDTAAVEVAEDRQQQARTITELCQSGAIEQDPAGQAVCDEAAQTAEQDPAETVAQAKSGPQGPPGPPGRPGADGADGSDGADGADGPVGTAGPEGGDGADGAPGEDGTPGSPGESGPAGEAGPSGEDGSAGAPGGTGPRGASGDTGPQGPAGPKGDPGPTGPTGDRGPAGEDGNDGRGIDSATCDPETSRWTITYTDDSTSDGGTCLVTPDDPAPTPTPTEEVTP
ncbi:hypothetical protein [Brachybacterium sp.]|uniref:hypothetical protein n=1 Tax=Brachybacterium sp. TaxID=1891286 RepID=UPI002ED609AB